MRTSRLTILVSGMIADDPYQGGATWAVLQYVLGFQRLGHDVYLVEPVNQAAFNSPETSKYFFEVTRAFGLEQKAALWSAGTQQTVGIPYEFLRQMSAKTDPLINISGMLTDTALTDSIATRVYLDLEPAFNQLWQAVQGIDMHFAGHTHFVTIGMAIGQAGCAVPTCGLEWLTTFQPVVLETLACRRAHCSRWPHHRGQLAGYGSIEHGGVFYGQKAHSLRAFIHLPRLTPEKFMPALAIHSGETKDLKALADSGWRALNPAKWRTRRNATGNSSRDQRRSSASPKAAMSHPNVAGSVTATYAILLQAGP